MGAGTILSGIIVGKDYSWRFGELPALFVEVGEEEMLVLVTYDVSTETAEGRKRLRHVAKKCLKYGQRVQNSVFECTIDWSQYLMLQSELKDIINNEEDSLRFYNLGNKYAERVIHVGVKPSIDMKGTLIV